MYCTRQVISHFVRVKEGRVLLYTHTWTDTHTQTEGCVPVLGGGVFHSAALQGTCLQFLLQRHGGPRHTLHSSMNKSLPCCAWGRGIMPQDGEKNLQLQSVLNHLLRVKGSGSSMAWWPGIVYHSSSFGWM